MSELNTFYFGKVIADSDMLDVADKAPLNRVKVYILGMSTADQESFSQPRGSNNEKTISQANLEIIGDEMYAYVMQPVMGTGTIGRYSATKDLFSVADVGPIENLDATPPAEGYMDNLYDGFVGGQGSSTAGVNVNSAGFAPDNRSNSYKGSMSMPGVGSTVVITFMNGKRGMPIIVGMLPGQADVDSIHGLGLAEEIYPNYPTFYSNIKGIDEVVEDGSIDATATANDTAGGTSSAGATASDDFSDLPSDKQELYSQLPPADAARYAAQDRARAGRIAASEADTIATIREAKGNAAANKAAAQLRANR